MKMVGLGLVLLISPCVRAADKPFDSKRNVEQDLKNAARFLDRWAPEFGAESADKVR